MKTIELMNDYKRGGTPMPDELWKRLTWMAAHLLHEAEVARNTVRRPSGERRPDDRQMELFA